MTTKDNLNLGELLGWSPFAKLDDAKEATALDLGRLLSKRGGEIPPPPRPS